MPRKHHRRRQDDWSLALTWTIRMDTVPRTLNRRAATLDRALRLSQLERRRRSSGTVEPVRGTGPLNATR